jgi:HD superfamily phosphohydrolase
MNAYQDIDELNVGSNKRHIIRIPDQVDVPVSARVLRIIDTAQFQRLKTISQLGLVSTVFPGAVHNRFEHSLGVYRTALLFLEHFRGNVRFTEIVSQEQAEAFLLASLLHDIGHWPFCHPIEDIAPPGIATHEELGKTYIVDSAIGQAIKADWSCDCDTVNDLIQGKKGDPKTALIKSLLSGPIDVDKMDYLFRDSLHAGVPYGQNFDSGRLISSLCINQSGDRLAITNKGRTAAELMVFARYVMFSEVYWHHAVRSATAMLQRAFFLFHTRGDHRAEFYTRWFRQSEFEFVRTWKNNADGECLRFLGMLFGDKRVLFKRAASYASFESETIFHRLAHRPYDELVSVSQQLVETINDRYGLSLGPHDILIDAPPVGLEVQFNVDVLYSSPQRYRKLGDVSPVVSTLAHKQFDDYVKQVRIFIHPDHTDALKTVDLDGILKSI